jgi:hypothetical protein
MDLAIGRARACCPVPRLHQHKLHGWTTAVDVNSAPRQGRGTSLGCQTGKSADRSPLRMRLAQQRYDGSAVTQFPSGAEGQSARLLELDDELVDRHRGARRQRVALILRMAQKIAFGHEFETRRLHFALDDVLVDSMQALA